MLRIEIINKTGGKISNYEYKVFINEFQIDDGIIVGYDTLGGWEGLVQELANSVEQASKK